jgi:hypothetical protein
MVAARGYLDIFLLLVTKIKQDKNQNNQVYVDLMLACKEEAIFWDSRCSNINGFYKRRH